MWWSIFILRSAKWGHSGGPAEYIPHLYHESSAAYYSCPAQGGLAFIQWAARACARAQASMRARSHARTSAQSSKRGDRHSPCDRQRAGCLMRKWMRGDIHWLPFTHRPPRSPQHSDFHLDEPSRHWVVTVTTSNNVYIFPKNKKIS